MKSLYRVVIVGRTNVGKSTLFNRLSTSAKSITYDVSGVTRDFITDEVTWMNRNFELIDTGGISFRKTTDVIAEQVRAKALAMVEQSDVLLMVIDASVPLTPEDLEIAAFIRKQRKPVILVSNKIDARGAKEYEYEAEQLGFKTRIGISAIHGRSIDAVLDAICDALPEKSAREIKQPLFNVVFLGKPNVGKSTLMNLLLKQERSIVTPQAGTTREPINERVTFYQEDILLTDTPGVRRKRSIEEPLETLMVRSSFKALDRAHIVLLLIDGSQPEISDQEWKLAFYAFEHHKALIVLYNKQDLATQASKKDLGFSNELYEHFLKKIPQLQISCKTGDNVGKIMPLVNKIWQHYSQTFNNDELNLLFKEALRERPLYHKTQLLKVHNAAQISTAPITIRMIVNEPSWFGDSQLGFFEAMMRKEYDLKGVPVKFIVRKGG